VQFSQAVLFRGADITLVWRSIAAMVVIGVVYYVVAQACFGASSSAGEASSL
jgi:ABC-2 type transport system permease protein